MAVETTSAEGVLTDLPTPILPNIDGEFTREGLVEVHQLVSRNMVYVLSNLGGGRHGHLTLTMTSKDYTAKTGFVFVPPHNPGNYPPTLGNTQDQSYGTEKFRQNQALFQKFTAVDEAFKKKIITAEEPVLLSPLVDHLTGFLQMSALTMIQHLLLRYGAIDEIDLEENAVNMMGLYEPPRKPWPN